MNGLRRPFAAYALLAVLAVAPVLAVGVPAFGDTLNHLARMHILATIGNSPDLHRYYQVHWSPIPYLAMDAIVPLLAHILPIYSAGKIFVAVCLLVPAAATIVLHRVVHGRFSLVPAAAFVLCTNYLLALGFLNYLLSMGLAVMLFAGWLAAAGWPRWRRSAAFALPLLALYFGHAFAALAYCLCVAGLEAAGALRRGRAQWRAAALDVLAAAAQAVPALLFAVTLDVASGYVGALNTDYGNFAVKLLALASPVLLLIDPTFLATSAMAVLVLFIVRRHIRLSPAIWPSCVALGLVALAMPHVVFSTWGMDYRLPLVACMLLVAGISLPARAAPRGRLFAVLALMVAARSGDAWLAWRDVDAEIAGTRTVLTHLPRGARLLVVAAGQQSTGLERITASTFWHLPMVAVIDRDAFVPTLFSGLSTVHVRPEYRLSSTPNGFLITPDQLREGAATRDDGAEHGDGQGARLYFHGWPEKFDYVLLQRQGADAGVMPAILHEVARGPDVTLYVVDRPR